MNGATAPRKHTVSLGVAGLGLAGRRTGGYAEGLWVIEGVGTYGLGLLGESTAFPGLRTGMLRRISRKKLGLPGGSGRCRVSSSTLRAG